MIFIFILRKFIRSLIVIANFKLWPDFVYLLSRFFHFTGLGDFDLRPKQLELDWARVARIGTKLDVKRDPIDFKLDFKYSR